MKRKRKKPLKSLTEKQKQVAQLYFEGHKVNEIASIVGVHRCTIWRWSRRKDLQKEINRISNKYIQEKRKEWRRKYYQSPEYKREQNRKYYARQRLKILAEQLEKAGNNGNMKEYRKASAAYDKCFIEAYFGGKTALDFLNSSRKLTGPKKASKPVKYIIEIVPKSCNKR